MISLRPVVNRSLYPETLSPNRPSTLFTERSNPIIRHYITYAAEKALLNKTRSHYKFFLKNINRFMDLWNH